ncbi:shikimate O-hydroxycinnamoyltransferase [Sarracenia purpurea var. burkii]
MEGIRFISTSIVQPERSNGESIDRIELTPWDLRFMLVGHIQKGLLFLKPSPLQEKLLPDTVVDHLKISFVRALEFFRPLAGRIGITKNDDTTSSFFVDWNDAGAHFIHAVADNIAVADILDPMHVPRIVHSFFPQNGAINYEGISKPLVAVQVTELADGFFVGCTMNHALVDGSSFWHFFNSWSEISRGSDSLSRPPTLKRWFPSEIDCPIRIPFCSDQIDDEFILAPVEARVFHFTKEKIAALKAKANLEMSTTKISSLQALLAHLWRSVVRCQRLNAGQEVKYWLLITARPRLEPPLPDGYFGCTIQREIVTTTAGELLEHGLGWVAWKLNQRISSQTNDEVRKFLKSWAENPALISRKQALHVASNNALVISSSPRFDVYGYDFGWGKPVAVRSGPENNAGGKMALFPGKEEGSVDIEACLSPEKLVALGDDGEFIMEALSI